MKGMATCKVCGRDFALMAEEHYVVSDPKKTGVMATLVNGEVRGYDAFDCPHCGCQYVAQERKPFAVAFEEYPPSDNGDNDDPFEGLKIRLAHSADGHGCENCKYENLDCEDEPCNSCRHCRLNLEECKYESKEEQ